MYHYVNEKRDLDLNCLPEIFISGRMPIKGQKWGFRMKRTKIERPYKPNYNAVLDNMEDRGLIIEDRGAALLILREVSPFHLENFGLQWVNEGKYCKGVSIAMLYQLYNADRMIKNFLFDYLADMEVQLRNVLGSILHEMAGPYGYLDKDYFKNEEYHETFIHDVENELRRANEPFVRAYRKDEEDKSPVPVYVALEVITMGSLSKLVSNLKRSELKKLASFYGLKSEKLIISFLKALTILRNTCAHHGRLSQRNFNVGVAFFNRDMEIIKEIEEEYRPNPYAFFAAFLALTHFLSEKKNKEMIYKMEEIFRLYPVFKPTLIDFPTHWMEILLKIVEEKFAEGRENHH